MKAFIDLFDRLCREVKLQKGETLCDITKFERVKTFKVSENKTAYSENGRLCEDYFNVYKQHGKYTVTEQHRASEYPCFENKSVEYAAVILFILLSRYEIDLWGSENTRKFCEAYDNDNKVEMKRLLLERFGYLLSFDRIIYDKISICVVAGKYIQVYYHSKFLEEFQSKIENYAEMRTYNKAYNACARIEAFRELLPKIKKIVPLEDEAENSKLEFLFVSGKNEDSATG